MFFRLKRRFLKPHLVPIILICCYGNVAKSADTVAPELQNLSNQIYTENYYLSRQDIFTSSLRLNAATTPFIRKPLGYLAGYIQAGNELSKLTKKDKPEPYSYSYVAPGLKLASATGSVAFFAEWRLRGYYDNKLVADANDNGPTPDRRALLVYNTFKEGADSGIKRLSWFRDLYSETLYTSADDDNIIHASYARFGYRLGAPQTAKLDVYVEPFITLDQNAHFYNNHIDLRPSLRILKSFSHIDLYFAYSYLMTKYIARSDMIETTNPYQNDPNGYRLMGVLSGVF